MAVADVPLVAMLKSRLHWYQTRQKVLAENVANADTPGFKPKDLKEPAFAPTGSPRAGSLSVSATSPLHLAGATRLQAGEETTAARRFEVVPSGNGVNLEDEMLKAGQNQSDFQLAASLYQKSLKMLTMAVGKGGA